MRTWTQMRKRRGLVACGLMIASETIYGAAPLPAVAPGGAARLMPQVTEQYTADRMSLNRIYPVIIAPARIARFERFDNDKLAMLAAMDFDKLAEEDQIDYLLLKTRLTADLRGLAMQFSRTRCAVLCARSRSAVIYNAGIGCFTRILTYRPIEHR